MSVLCVLSPVGRVLNFIAINNEPITQYSREVQNRLSPVTKN